MGNNKKIVKYSKNRKIVRKDDVVLKIKSSVRVAIAHGGRWIHGCSARAWCHTNVQSYVQQLGHKARLSENKALNWQNALQTFRNLGKL